MLLCFVIASIDTKSHRLFIQNRIGKDGKPFKIYKLKTISDSSKLSSSIGRFLRSTKIDELPQLFNVVMGTMSFVGPRPDIAGYADLLLGDDKVILKVKPGITGLASLKYRNEEFLLAQQSNPVVFNDEVIWPDKIRINKWYVQNRNLWMDILILCYTVLPIQFDVDRFINDWNK